MESGFHMLLLLLGFIPFLVECNKDYVETSCAYGKCTNPLYKWYSKSEKEKSDIPTCKGNPLLGRIDLDEGIYPSPFRDLTSKEIVGLLQYLYSEMKLNLTVAEKATVDSNYIFSAEIFLPPKEDVLSYLDRGYPKPPREARVIVFRGGIPEPDVIEIIVGPLPYPTDYRHVPYRPESLPFADRPPSATDNNLADINQIVDDIAGNMLYDLYGGRLVDCGDRCLIFNYGSFLTSVLSGSKKRQVFHWLEHFVEHYVLRPLDFALLTEREANNDFRILKVWFSGRLFDSLEQAVEYYNHNRNSIHKVHFPVVNRQSPLTVNSRGEPPFFKPLKNPSQVSPDGKRYNIIDRHVSYSYWEFDIANAIFTGPRINDIKYKNERIAYEVSLQEIANFYSGYKPHEYALSFLDTRWQIGTLAKYLIPGIDCPQDATFISSSFKIETQDTPLVNDHAFCVFEFNTGLPLRRHHGYFTTLHRFFEGVENIVLVVRTIPTVVIYDYIIDFIFYQNGVMEVKITPSGIVSSTWYGRDNPYSWQVNENLMSPMHHHLFNFKVDLDIKGTFNRFETLDIEPDVVKNEVHKDPSATIVQNKFTKRLKSTEKQAACQFDFDFPQYLTFVNNMKKDKFGNSPGYRLVNGGMTKLLRPPDEANNPGVYWAKYQVAVTKYKDSEPNASPIYAISENPVFTFKDFIDDNENIVDEDLVAWVSMGLYHIVQKEDLPVTHTPGLSKSIHLIPYNYFDESPGMSAGNAVRVDAVDIKGKTKAVKIRRSGIRSDVDCIPEKNPFEEMLYRDPCQVVECL